MNRRPARLHDRARATDGALGPGVEASSNVLIGNKRALAIGHRGMRGNAIWRASAGAKRVLLNRRPAHRQLDLTAPDGVQLDGASYVLIGDYDHPSRTAIAKIRVRIVHAGGAPAKGEPYELTDDDGNVVVSGALDENGRLELDDVPWTARTLRLTTGWTVRIR